MVLQCIFAIIVLGNSKYIFTIKKKKRHVKDWSEKTRYYFTNVMYTRQRGW